MKNCYLLVILFLTSLINATAQTFYNTESGGQLNDTIPIDEVEVTTNKISISRKNAPLIVSVINRKEIEQSDETALLPILSQRIPGFFVTERGVTGFGVAEGAAGAISIRGIGGSPTTGVLMLIDGHPQFMGIMGHPLADSYVASDVERVEVIRGPASVLYGSNAMGGVINIITRQEKKDGLSGNARLMYGSYNTQKYMVNGGYKKKKFTVFASLNHNRTDGHRDSSDFMITNGYLKAGIGITDKINLTADFNLAGFKASDPGPVDEMAGERIDILRGMASLSLENHFSGTEGAFKFFHNFGNHKITDGFRSDDFNSGMMFYQGISILPNTLITAGVDFKKYGGKARNVFANGGEGIVIGNETINELAGYTVVQYTYKRKLTLNAGLRLENNSVYGTEWIPQAGFAYSVNSFISVKGNASKGFRSPTIRELYLFPPANENLKPEEVMNYELGIMGNISPAIEMELTGFVLKGSNIIQVEGQFPAVHNVNSGTFHNNGIEFSSDVNLPGNIELGVNYSYINMKKVMIGTPEHQLFTFINYKWKKLSLNGNVQLISNLALDNNGHSSSYTVINAKADYAIRKKLHFFISGRNLTDQYYVINQGYPMPGITFFMGINAGL
ncbi:MAG TPA: TonB-dependent receptor [Bacteroidales bacterium]|nr:TonB-dependent receptor [Bacteroidales bacterium]